MEGKTKKYIELLAKFNELPNKKIEDENIFSICRFPHYEKVTSNVLAFFLDNKREHGLGNLFIESLLSLHDSNASDFDLNYIVETESHTAKGNFIDLDIFGNDYRIIIENKIFASLYNDLDDYYHFASKESKNVIAFVLSLLPQPIKLPEKYTFITYEMLFEEVRKRIGGYISDANQKYLPFLFDFMKNIENLQRGDDMNLEFIKFVKDNEEQVNSINEKLNHLHKDFRKTVESVNTLVLDGIEKQDKVKQWSWRRLPEFFDTAVTDMNFGRGIIALDSIIDLSGWHFNVFLRKADAEFDVEVFFKNICIEYDKKEGNRYILSKQFEIEEKPNIVAEFIIGIVNTILKDS